LLVNIIILQLFGQHAFCIISQQQRQTSPVITGIKQLSTLEVIAKLYYPTKAQHWLFYQCSNDLFSLTQVVPICSQFSARSSSTDSEADEIRGQ
jgi:hypothetical protein